MRLRMGSLIGVLLLGQLFATPFDRDAFAGPKQSLFKRPDQAFRARKSDARALEALNGYRAIWNASSQTNVEAGWKLAMTCYFTGLRLTQDPEAKEKLFREGVEAATAAAKLEPSCAACEFWAAIDTALLGETIGVFKMISLLGEVKNRLNRVIELDPAYAYGGAFRLLGMIEEKLPGILGGDNDRAREYFERAIKTAPDEPLNYLFMAKLMAKEFSDPVTAEDYAQRGLKAIPKDTSRIESFEALTELREFLTGLKAPRPAPAEQAQYRRQGPA